MASQLGMAAALQTAAGSNLVMDPWFITKRRNHFKMQDLETVKVDQTCLQLYPAGGAEATDAEKNHAFNVARAAFAAERRITIEDGLVVAASRLNYATQLVCPSGRRVAFRSPHI